MEKLSNIKAVGVLVLHLELVTEVDLTYFTIFKNVFRRAFCNDRSFIDNIGAVADV